MSIKEEILYELKVPMNGIVERIIESEKKEFLERTGQVMKISEWYKEMIRLSLVIDLMKALQNYVSSEDKLISMNWCEGGKGIEINAKIGRGSEVYEFFTEAIYAGGYNIQRLHLRYLTKTKMPRIKSELAREYQEQYKKLTKIEKLEQEIQRYQNRILEIDYNLSSIEGITDERIGTILTKEGHWSHNNPSWEQIIKNGAADNFNNSETEYLESVEKSKKHGIEFWRTQNIEWPTRTRIGYRKELTKLQSKLGLLK